MLLATTFLDNEKWITNPYCKRVCNFTIQSLTELKSNILWLTSNDFISNFVKEDLKLKSVVGNNFVEISWPYIPDQDGIYEIFRNGVLIDTTKNNSYIDTTVEPNQIYNYRVQVKNSLSLSEKSKREEELKKHNVNIEQLTEEQKNDVYTKAFD
jgi:hypothetical protein